ncbi:MAG TPA: SCO family protein [Candidatus Methylomirabilis sp.]|nr:SCO family protein [Candidatus Methylomirabilis sp.]
MSGRLARSIRSPLTAIWSGALLLGFLGIAMWSWQGPRFGWRHGEEGSLEGLQVFATLPDFSLVERDGRPITLADLRGKVWIADFIYTHCTDTCPLQTAEMARLQADLATEADVRFVSITVDPAQDTPEVLAGYAARFGADRERWLFLTGRKHAIYTLAQKGFLLSVEDPGEAVPAARGSRQSPPSELRRAASLGMTSALKRIASRFRPVPVMAHPGHLSTPFLHSTWFVLVDRQARIRGYYRSEDDKAMRRLRGAVRTLLQETG